MGNRLWLTFSIVAPMLLAIFGSAHPQVVSPSTYGIKRTGYTSSSVCKSCHEAHYGYWTKTMHSKAYEDPIFQVAFLRAQVDEGEQVRAYCLSCHSPTTRVTKDFSTEKELSWEGVTCDFCHTITAVDLSREEFSYDLGITKRGPYKDAESPAHLTAYSPLFEWSEFCGGCHEQRSRNGEGVLVLGTYTEWKESPYAAKEVHCQNCHMPKEPGVPIVKPDVKATDKILTAHEFMGGHSEIKLEKAAEVKTYIERDGDKATITTFVTNKES
ncbi:MAG: multiheme c-type cytochrome, partial [bacterium]